MFSVRTLIQSTKGTLLSDAGVNCISGVSIDTRTLKKGDLYIAIKGASLDGHRFIPQAIRCGAKVLMVSKKIKVPSTVTVIQVKDTTQALGHIAAVHRQRFNIPVIAITGSVGKTTTKELLASVLKTQYRVLKNEKSFNNQFGVPLTLLQMREHHNIVVLECGTNQPNDMKWLGTIAQPTTVIFLNIGESHLEGLKNCRGVFQEKMTLLKNCAPKGHCIFNADDPYLSRLINKKITQKKISFSIKAAANVKATNVTRNKRGGFSFKVRNKQYQFKSPSVDHLANALAAISCGDLYNISYTNINKNLSVGVKAPGRMQVFPVKQGFVIDDTYNANPMSLKSAIHVLDQFEASGSKILCVADMLELGPHAQQLHEEIGDMCVRSSINTVISFGTQARWVTERIKALKAPINVFHYKTQAGVSGRVKKCWQKDSVALVKGSRGMHMERVVERVLRSC
ncbi:UDP-N-acetylmuramoyl-tripeptide--D-alanyl-D-alanine ligase [Candidatus Omnitrophota bacterium]